MAELIDAATRFRQSENFEAATRFHNVIMDAYDALQMMKAPDATWRCLTFDDVIIEKQTVILNLPRQVGKTTSLLYLLERDPANSVLFVPNAGILRMIQTSLHPLPGTSIMSISAPESSFRGKTFQWKNILLDEPDHIGRADLRRLLKNVVPNIPYENQREIRIFGLGTA